MKSSTVVCSGHGSNPCPGLNWFGEKVHVVHRLMFSDFQSCMLTSMQLEGVYMQMHTCVCVCVCGGFEPYYILGVRLHEPCLEAVGAGATTLHSVQVHHLRRLSGVAVLTVVHWFGSGIKYACVRGSLCTCAGAETNMHTVCSLPDTCLFIMSRLGVVRSHSRGQNELTICTIVLFASLRTVVLMHANQAPRHEGFKPCRRHGFSSPAQDSLVQQLDGIYAPFSNTINRPCQA